MGWFHFVELIISCNIIGVLINFVEASKILQYTKADLKKIAARVAENVEEICRNQLVRFHTNITV